MALSGMKLRPPLPPSRCDAGFHTWGDQVTADGERAMRAAGVNLTAPLSREAMLRYKCVPRVDRAAAREPRAAARARSPA